MQAYITRLTVPSDIDRLRQQFRQDGMLDIEWVSSIVPLGPVLWSVPRHAMVGDAVFFQVTMKSLTNLRALKRAIPSLSGDLRKAVELAVLMIEQFAGGIIGVGRVIEDVQRLEPTPDDRVKSTFSAWIDDLYALDASPRFTGEEPWSDWSEFTGPGPVTHRQFASDDHFQQFVAALAEADPELPERVRHAHIDPIPNGTRLTKQNWMHYATADGAVFTSEAHLRGLYGDWLLRELSDRRTLYTEVGVTKAGRRTGQVDYVIVVDGVPVPIEAKLDSDHEYDLDAQLDKYRQPDLLTAGSRNLPAVDHDVVCVIDRHGFTITHAGSRPKTPTLSRESTTPGSILVLRRSLQEAIR